MRGGADSSGYLNAAKLLARGKLTDSVEPLTRFNLSQDYARVFIPLGFSPGIEPGTMVPSYPLGLPLHMAAAGLVGGWARAPYWVSPLAAALCLLLVYGIGRELGMSRPFAVAPSVCLAVFSTFVSYGLQPMSDVPATAWTLGAVLAALRTRRNRGEAYLCGAALGMAILVRPTNILAAIPVLLALPLERKIFLRVALGGLPFAAFLLTANQIANGNAFASGYGNMASGFSLGFFPARIRHYGYWLAALGTPLLVLGWVAGGGRRPKPAAPDPPDPRRLAGGLPAPLLLLAALRNLVVHAVPAAVRARDVPRDDVRGRTRVPARRPNRSEARAAAAAAPGSGDRGRRNRRRDRRVLDSQV